MKAAISVKFIRQTCTRQDFTLRLFLSWHWSSGPTPTLVVFDVKLLKPIASGSGFVFIV
ncbi:hypothetical protein [Spirosoma pulveris]